ncbi:MAG: hypothetical protein IJF67_02110 [Clostridia bacterium]|nr:hypothetical protein [Clostridia bacterium]
MYAKQSGASAFPLGEGGSTRSGETDEAANVRHAPTASPRSRMPDEAEHVRARANFISIIPQISFLANPHFNIFLAQNNSEKSALSGGFFLIVPDFIA